jgi:hypothetical protein
MTLLADIQAAALDSTVDLADTLRKCKVLAARLKHEEFAHWVAAELNGYNEANGYAKAELLPDYRRLTSHSIGSFALPGGGLAKNVPIPPSRLPDEFQRFVNALDFNQSVSALGEMLRTCAENGGVANIPWHAELVAYVQHHVAILDSGAVLMDAHLLVTTGAVKSVLDTVRTRVLDFVLAIEAENPDAGEVSPAAPPPISQDRLGDIFHVVVQQGSQVIIGNRGHATITTGAISFSPAIPAEKHSELDAHLAELRGHADAVADASDRTEAKNALVKLETQLAKPRPDPARTQSYIQLYAAIVTAAAPTVDALTKLLQAIGWL